MGRASADLRVHLLPGEHQLVGPARELLPAFPCCLQLLLTVVSLVQVSKAEVMDLGKSLCPRFQC